MKFLKMPSIKLEIAIALAIATALSGCNVPTVIVDPDVFSQMDKFMKNLANRGADNIGKADDFQIVVTQADYPLGTLMRTGSTIPIDYTACLPAKAPDPVSTPSLFPTYHLSNALAIDFGLDNDVIKQLVDFGITIKDSDTVDISVKEPKMLSLSDTDMTNILSKTSCKAVIPSTSAWLVRGYIRGQRTFALKADNSNIVKGKIDKIASFNISPNSGNSSLDITDTGVVDFLQIVSQVTISSPLEKTSNAQFTKPEVTNAQGKIYVQRDRSDTSNNGELIVAALKSASLVVASGIERIDSSRMPNTAQVRYFNETDKPLADKALAQLQKQFSNAKLVKISLPAPAGQIEVWLSKT